jgi:lipid-A-disaccharide synthase
MKYFIVSGESSGDLHAAKLVEALKKQDPLAEIFGMGSVKMQEAGAQILLDSKELSVMGFWQVFIKIFTLVRCFKFIQKAILEKQPHAIVFIDFAGFNLRMAAWAKKKGFTTYYYISPKIWAWKTSRALKIKKYIDKMFVILPFEVPFYKSYGVDVHYVGNPLLDRIENRIEHKEKEDFILLLPGSRKAEITYILPVMLQLTQRMPKEQFVIARAHTVPHQMLKEGIDKYCSDKNHSRVKIGEGDSHIFMRKAKAAVVASGTATLETALYYTPQVVCYKSDCLSIQLAKRLIKVPYISLVNLITQKSMVQELIQENCTAQNIQEALNPLLEDSLSRNAALQDCEDLWKLMGDKGASERTARGIIAHMQSNHLLNDQKSQV